MYTENLMDKLKLKNTQTTDSGEYRVQVGQISKSIQLKITGSLDSIVYGCKCHVKTDFYSPIQPSYYILNHTSFSNQQTKPMTLQNKFTISLLHIDFFQSTQHMEIVIAWVWNKFWMV